MESNGTDPNKLQKEERETIRQVLRYIKILFHSGNWPLFVNLMSGANLKKRVIKPLEKVADWDKHMEREALERAEELKEVHKGPPEHRKRNIWKILGIGGTVTGAAIAMFLRRNRNKKDKSTES